MILPSAPKNTFPGHFPPIQRLNIEKDYTQFPWRLPILIIHAEILRKIVHYDDTAGSCFMVPDEKLSKDLLLL